MPRTSHRIALLASLAAVLFAGLPGAHATTPVKAVAAAGGHITIRHDATGYSYVKTGVYAIASEFQCSPSVLTTPITAPVRVACVEQSTSTFDWDCTHFILKAQAPATTEPTASGNVRGGVACDTGTVLWTPDVIFTGVEKADNLVAGVTLGRAHTVNCVAGGVLGAIQPTGSWEVDCWEPGVAMPF
jgi:hypothetical protein